VHAEAYAKVNLSLQVRPADLSGKHPLRSLVQSIDWADRVSLADAEEDRLAVTGLAVPAEGGNLAWRALEAVRSLSSRPSPVLLQLEKAIPVAAGLGGGSADAAAVLALAAERFGVPDAARDALAPDLGADVPFCLMGGTAWMEGYGERLDALPNGCDYVLAVVVPPFEVPTADVYRRWDELGGPEGGGVSGRLLPLSLREYAPLRNDLAVAALDLFPELGDWISDVNRLWNGPVLVSGSGPALFGFFGTESEAADAAGAVEGARGVRACRPTRSGRSTGSG
jgi:4-diphosphocytidyl-2-C-methyl-D-erythritol kinase